MKTEFDYNAYGRQQTGFDNSLDHSTFGHWSNPEYQQLQQDAELIDRERQEANAPVVYGPRQKDELPL